MEEAPWPADKVRKVLEDASTRDLGFERGEILGSMCTQPHALAAEAFQAFLSTNLGDPDHFPGAAGLEEEVLADLADLVGGDRPEQARFLTGGTEANLQACYLAREKTGKRVILASEAAHFSFEKAAKMLDMELRRVPCREDLRSDPVALADAIDGDTAIIIAIAGSTELGLVDDIAAIAAAAKRARVWCHVDGAFGGYVLPFLDRPAWALGVPGVQSVALDPHKMGRAPVPAGALVVRDAKAWDKTAIQTSYVSTATQSTLMGTRPGGAVAAVWAVHRALGRQGYRETVARCIATATRIAGEIQVAGAELVAAPELNVVTFRFGDAEATHAALAKAGFRLNIVPRFGALRIVVGPHVTPTVADRFLTAFQELDR